LPISSRDRAGEEAGAEENLWDRALRTGGYSPCVEAISARSRGSGNLVLAENDWVPAFAGTNGRFNAAPSDLILRSAMRALARRGRLEGWAARFGLAAYGSRRAFGAPHHEAEKRSPDGAQRNPGSSSPRFASLNTGYKQRRAAKGPMFALLAGLPFPPLT
jgi:hypothetical protein